MSDVPATPAASTAPTPTPTAPTNDSGQSQAQTLALQTVLNSLVTTTLETPQQKRKRRRVSEEDADQENSDPSSTSQGKSLTDYAAYGRHAARVCEPGFTKMTTIVKWGIMLETKDSGDEAEEVTDESRHLDESWDIICKIIPLFRETMISLATHGDIYRRVCRDISKGIDDSRGDDCGSLKKSIIGYLLLDTTIALDPPIPLDRKMVRGWAHPVTAKLLCPLEYPWTDETNEQLTMGVKTSRPSQLPRYLFPDDQEYTPTLDGVLTGHLMLRVAKHLFMGPSAALEGPGYHRGRGGNAAINGMARMTPRSIAYVAVQVHFALSGKQEWSRIDSTLNFDHSKFFWNIVSLFDDGAGSDILALYDYQVFGHRDNAPPSDADAEVGSDVHTFEACKAARIAKRKALLTEATV